jgi:hypothetical protein
LVTPLTPLIHPPTKTEKQVETVVRPNTQIPRQLATSTDSCAEPYFPALPDVEVIAKIAGFPHVEPKSLPLFLAGLQALENPEPLMPLPTGKLDYAGPWITWLRVQ